MPFSQGEQTKAKNFLSKDFDKENEKTMRREGLNLTLPSKTRFFGLLRLDVILWNIELSYGFVALLKVGG